MCIELSVYDRLHMSNDSCRSIVPFVLILFDISKTLNFWAQSGSTGAWVFHINIPVINAPMTTKFDQILFNKS